MSDPEPSDGLQLTPIRIYTDEAGREIKVYPTRYAMGGVGQQVTAKPSVRGRGQRE